MGISEEGGEERRDPGLIPKCAHLILTVNLGIII